MTPDPFLSTFQSVFGMMLAVVAGSVVAFIVFIAIAQILDKWPWWSGKT